MAGDSTRETNEDAEAISLSLTGAFPVEIDLAKKEKKKKRAIPR